MTAAGNTAGPAAAHDASRPGDWNELDNFPTLDLARAYMWQRSRAYPTTPYRVTRRAGPDRYAVEYVPAWKLDR